MLKQLLGVIVGVVCAAKLPAQATGTRPDLLTRLRLPVRYAQVFGQRLAYYEAGPANAPVVVLIPSLGWDAHAWAQNLPTLAQTFHVIAVDPLGLGKSDKPLDDADDMGCSPRRCDRRIVAASSGNSGSHREELTHARVGGQPSHIF